MHNTGVVAAYGFDEPSGATANDAIDGRNGAITGATRVVDGRYGNALSFDGVDDWVTVPHDAGLNLSAGMTIEAWVKPSALTSWRSVVTKEHTTALAVRALRQQRHRRARRERVHDLGAERIRAARPRAVDVDAPGDDVGRQRAAALRRRRGGRDPARPGRRCSRAAVRSGSAATPCVVSSSRASIDEVRVYDRALTAARIGADMNAPVTP